MKTKEYLIIFYDNKKQSTSTFIYSANNMRECYLYVHQTILSNVIYDDEHNLPFAVVITEISEKTLPIELSEIDTVFIVFCKKKGYKDLDIKSFIELSDGKTVQLAADNLGIGKKVLEIIITNLNESTGCGTSKQSITSLYKSSQEK